MPGVTGRGLLSRVRSQRKMRAQISEEELETPKLSHRRQHSDSATMSRSSSTRVVDRSDYRGHWPPIEFDPLKLNPPVPEAPHAPARLHERQPLHCPRPKRSFASVENRRPPRLHHSDSGFSLHGYQEFDFALEKDKAMLIVGRERNHHDDIKGWPSPASSVDSNKSWFDDDDEDSYDDDETAAPLPQRRQPIGSPDDPTNFIKRGEWKRRGIFFGVQTEEVATRDDDAFEI